MPSTVTRVKVTRKKQVDTPKLSRGRGHSEGRGKGTAQLQGHQGSPELREQPGRVWPLVWASSPAGRQAHRHALPPDFRSPGGVHTELPPGQGVGSTALSSLDLSQLTKATVLHSATVLLTRTDRGCGCPAWCGSREEGVGGMRGSAGLPPASGTGWENVAVPDAGRAVGRDR